MGYLLSFLEALSPWIISTKHLNLTLKPTLLPISSKQATFQNLEMTSPFQQSMILLLSSSGVSSRDQELMNAILEPRPETLLIGSKLGKTVQTNLVLELPIQLVCARIVAISSEVRMTRTISLMIFGSLTLKPKYGVRLNLVQILINPCQGPDIVQIYITTRCIFLEEYSKLQKNYQNS